MKQAYNEIWSWVNSWDHYTFLVKCPPTLLLANINTYFPLRAKCWLRGGVGGHFPSNLWWVEHTTWKRVACLIFHCWSQASASFATAARFRIVTQSRTCLHSIATSWIALRKLAPRRVTTIDCCITKKGKSVSMLTYTFKVILRFCLNSSSLPLRERKDVSPAQDRAKIITKYTQLSFPILRTLKKRFVFGNLTMFDFILQSIFIFTFERQRYALIVQI